MDKLIITCAITGAELTHKQAPALPLTAEAQAAAARDCVEAGASIIHLHVRDDAGHPSQELAHFKRSVDAIYQACQTKPIIQFSTGGALGDPMEKRIAPLSLKPDMGSFNTGTMNFGDDVFVNSFPDMRGLAAGFKQHGVTPEFEIYDLGHLANLERLIKEGLVTPPYHVQFVLGVPGGMQGDCFKDLAPLVACLPQPCTWGVAGIGRFQLPLATVAIATGGHVRVGLEDNIYYTKGVLATSNAQLVKRVGAIARAYGRDIATIAEAREHLGLSPH